MYIDQKKCVQCKTCIPYCPIRAISYNNELGIVEIGYDECVECGVCKNSNVCPTDALAQQEMEYPRTLRMQFSNPTVTHPGTGVLGRGTEEMKTNDVTNVFKRGMAGVAIEMGRPGVGTRLYDAEKVAMAVSKEGIHFNPNNPLTELMEDTSTGKFKEEALNVKVLSAIVEFDIEQSKLTSLFLRLKKVIPEIDTVFSLDLACRLEKDGSNPVIDAAEKSGFKVSINGKTNVGLGRPLAREE